MRERAAGEERRHLVVRLRHGALRATRVAQVVEIWQTRGRVHELAHGHAPTLPGEVGEQPRGIVVEPKTTLLYLLHDRRAEHRAEQTVGRLLGSRCLEPEISVAVAPQEQSVLPAKDCDRDAGQGLSLQRVANYRVQPLD